jgi:hypothetical protein
MKIIWETIGLALVATGGVKKMIEQCKNERKICEELKKRAIWQQK